MKVHWVLDGNAAILRPKGNLHDDPEINALVGTATGLVEKGNRALLIDLGDVPFISSLGLGGLTRIHKAYSERDGRVVLCDLTHRVHTTFEIVKLGLIFDMFESEREAIRSMAGWLRERTTA